MYYIVETEKSFSTSVTDLEEQIKALGYGVLHIHDIGETLRNKGQDFIENCKVFEVCNPSKAAKILSVDMRLNMALPCRISVYTENGKTKIGFIKPGAMLSSLSNDSELALTGKEVEEKLIQMVDNTK